MRTLVIAMMAVIISMSACRKEKANIDTRQAPKQTRLSKIIHRNVTQKWEHTFRYNNKGYLAEYSVQRSHNDSWSYTEDIDYEMDANNRVIKEIAVVKYSDGEDESERTGVYVYNDDGTLNRVNYTAENEPDGYTEYKRYNGRISGIYDYSAKDERKSGVTIQYDTYGNVAEVEYIAINLCGGVYRVHNIRHDDKPNYVHTIKGFVNIAQFPVFDPQLLSVNNVTSYEYRQGDVYSQRTVANEITYNEHYYLSGLARYEGLEVKEFFYEEY